MCLFSLKRVIQHACVSVYVCVLACIWVAFSDYIWLTIEGSCREGVRTVTEVSAAKKRCSTVKKTK